MNSDEDENYASATFRIFGPDWTHPDSGRTGTVEPDEVTALLGINPTHSHRRGDPGPDKGRGPLPKTWPSGQWSLGSDGHAQSSHVENHVKWLLEQLSPVRDVIREYVRERNVAADFYCQLHLTGHSGVVLSTDLLRGLAELGFDWGLSLNCESAD